MVNEIEVLIKENKRLKQELKISEGCADSALRMCDHYYEYIEKLDEVAKYARLFMAGKDVRDDLSKALNELDKYEEGDIDEG